MKILCIYGSPRERGNSDILMEEFIKGLEIQGGKVERVYIRSLKILPCNGCGKCVSEKRCIIEDDMKELYGKLKEANALILSTPVYFLSFPAKLKTFIDRLQPFWVRKEIYKENWRKEEGKGVLISTAGYADEKVFECLVRQTKVIFRLLGYNLVKMFLYGGLEGKGEVNLHPEWKEKVRRGGELLMKELSI